MKYFRLLISVLLIFQSAGAYAQDTTYIYLKSLKKIKEVKPSKAAVIVINIHEEGDLVERQIRQKDNNQILQHKFYANDRPVGNWQYFNEYGDLIRERNFSKLVYKANLPQHVQDSLKALNEIFLASGGILAEFPGGDDGLMAFLGKEIKYPVESKNNLTSGTVYIHIIVDSLGNAKPDYIIKRGVDGYMDLVVWEIVEKMPLWKPGHLNGEAVSIAYNLPVKFTLR